MTKVTDRLNAEIESLKEENADTQESLVAADTLARVLREYLTGTTNRWGLEDALMKYELTRWKKDPYGKINDRKAKGVPQLRQAEPEPFMIDMNVPNAWD